jgi:hypothetical protein
MHVNGSWHMEKCLALQKRLLNLDTPCYYPERKAAVVDGVNLACAINGAYQPRLYDSKFMVIGKYLDIMEKFGFENQCALHEFYTSITNFCRDNGGESAESLQAMTWDTETGKAKWHDVDTGVTTPANLCFRALYIYTLLSEGIKLHPDTVLHYPPKELTSWAAGSMVYDLNYYPFTQTSDTLLSQPMPASHLEEKNEAKQETSALQVVLHHAPPVLLGVATLMIGFTLGFAKASYRGLQRSGTDRRAFHYRILD